MRRPSPMIPGDINSIYSEWESDRLEGPKSRGEGAAGQAAPRGERLEKPRAREWELGGIGRRRRRRRTRQRRAEDDGEGAGERTRLPKHRVLSQKREWRERRPRGGMQVAARIGERLRREMARGRRPSPKGGRWLATPNTPSFPRNPCVCGGGGVPSSPRRRADRSVSSSKTFYLEQAGRRAPTRPSAPGSGRACTVGTKRSPNQVSSLST